MSRWDREYRSLPAETRAALNDLINAIFRDKTGFTGKLDPHLQPQLAARWIEIRDQVLANRHAFAQWIGQTASAISDYVQATPIFNLLDTTPAWIRIARVRSADGTSDHLQGYSGNDGVNWDLREDVDLNDDNHAGWLDNNGNPAGAWPSVCYVGLGSTSHTGIGNNNAMNAATGLPYQCWVVYRDFGDVTATTPGPTVSVTHNADGTLTLTYTGNLYSSGVVVGPYAIVTGATSPYTVNPKTAGPATYYRSGP